MSEDARLNRLRDTIAKGLAGAQEKALANIEKVLDPESAEGNATWSESSTRTRVSLSLVQASMAAERAKTMSQAPKQLGVVVVHARLEDTPQNRLTWEQQAAALNEGRTQAAIEAVAVEKPEEAA